MKFVRVIGAGALAMFASEFAMAANSHLDRPTPPPYCADGVCYPNAENWGWYQQRWRRWPTEELQPTRATGAPKPGQAIPDVNPYETPTPEEEDQRAPPRSKPREEPESASERPREAPLERPGPGGSDVPGTTPMPSGPLTPGPSPLTPPPSQLQPGPTTPFTPGPGDQPPSLLAPPTNRMPWENGDQPMGEWDPPPSLPSATAVSVDRPAASSAGNHGAAPKPARPSARRPQSPGSDPPPALPVALASATY